MCVFIETKTERLQLFIPYLQKMMVLLDICQQEMPLEKILYQRVYVQVFVCYDWSRTMTNKAINQGVYWVKVISPRQVQKHKAGVINNQNKIFPKNKLVKDEMPLTL